MRANSVFIVAVLTLSVGCSAPPVAKTSEKEPDPPKLVQVEGLSRYALAQPISYGSVSLVPIVDVSKSGQDPWQGQYMSLAEARAKKLIEIQEVPEDAQVEQLVVRNLGEKPILLLAGELLLGGQQDRVVSKDTVIPPGKAIKVPVFCVEPDRWEGKTKKFDGDGKMVPQSVRKEATFGDQSRVWGKVGQYNGFVARARGEANLPAEYGTSVRGGLADEGVNRSIEADLPKFRTGLASTKNVVGFIYLLNGEIQNAEIFGHPKLFDQGRDGLLRGMLADASVTTPTKAVSKNFSMSECSEFLKEVMAGKSQHQLKRDGTVDFTISGTNVEGREASISGATPASKSLKDGFLHGTYSKK